MVTSLIHLPETLGEMIQASVPPGGKRSVGGKVVISLEAVKWTEAPQTSQQCWIPLLVLHAKENPLSSVLTSPFLAKPLPGALLCSPVIYLIPINFTGLLKKIEHELSMGGRRSQF